jgi:hypothetical protein
LKKNIFYFWLAAFFATSFGCKEKGFIPGYIYIDEIFLETDANGLQGSNSHGITNISVTMKGKEIGQFEPPCAIPLEILGEETEILISASVKENGGSNPRKLYPFYAPTTIKLNLKQGVIDTLSPVFRYRANTFFAWIEDFENGMSLSRSGNGDTTIVLERTNNPLEVKNYDGESNQFSAKALMPNGFRRFEYSSNAEFDLPIKLRGDDAREFFLEFDYKTDVVLAVGYYAQDFQGVKGVSVVEYFPNNSWNKAYVNFTSDFNTLPNQNTKIRIVFNAIKGSDMNEGTILIDNIKLVHN